MNRRLKNCIFRYGIWTNKRVERVIRPNKKKNANLKANRNATRVRLMMPWTESSLTYLEGARQIAIHGQLKIRLRLPAVTAAISSASKIGRLFLPGSIWSLRQATMGMQLLKRLNKLRIALIKHSRR